MTTDICFSFHALLLHKYGSVPTICKTVTDEKADASERERVPLNKLLFQRFTNYESNMWQLRVYQQQGLSNHRITRCHIYQYISYISNPRHKNQAIMNLTSRSLFLSLSLSPSLSLSLSLVLKTVNQFRCGIFSLKSPFTCGGS